MSNIIVELSNSQADNVISNGEFETTFQPTTINKGDIIQIKNAFIDTIQQSYDQIYIPADVNIELTFCFYEMDIDNPPDAGGHNKRVHHGSPTGQATTYQLYIAFNRDPVTPGNGQRFLMNDVFQGTILKGLYTPTSLAVEITRQMTSVGSPQSGFGGSWIRNPFYYYTVGEDSVNAYQYCLLQFDSTPNNNCDIDYNIDYAYYASNVWLSGAREVSLVYNDQGDNKFQFNYLHTPHYDANRQEVIGWANVGNEQVINRESGIIFLDMQPKDFWTSLGFNVSKMCMDWGMPVDQLLVTDHPQPVTFVNANMTTENFITIDDIYLGVNCEVVNTGDKISNYTRGISADQFYSFRNLSPFIMLEFLTNYNGTYLTGKDKSNFISGIVSRNYTQNNYITGYSDSAIAYEHKGEPFVLSSIRTRILDPATKDIENDLGPNNFIILNIIKNN